MNNPIKTYLILRRWRKNVPTMSHAVASEFTRVLAQSRSARDRRLAIICADRAIDTAEDEAVETVLRRYRTALIDGRRIRVATFPATFSTVPVPQELVDEIEEVFNKE